MAKDKTAYVCSNCGQESPKWVGKCPSCGQWNTFKEIKIAADTKQKQASAAASAGHALRNNKVLRLHEISSHDDPRIDMHDAEFNRVLGGGLVPGSIVLLGGEPGIGKSTLSLQTMLNMPEKRILYVSGEESAHQLKMRAERLSTNTHHLSPNTQDNFLLLTENSLEAIFDHIKEVQPELIVIDSIQTISTEDVESSAGSIAQVRECASALLRFAKTSGVPVILIGHITKEGTLAHTALNQEPLWLYGRTGHLRDATKRIATSEQPIGTFAYPRPRRTLGHRHHFCHRGYTPLPR